MIFWVLYESNNALEIFTDGGKRIRRHVRQSSLQICVCLVTELIIPTESMWKMVN